MKCEAYIKLPVEKLGKPRKFYPTIFPVYTVHVCTLCTSLRPLDYDPPTSYATSYAGHAQEQGLQNLE